LHSVTISDYLISHPIGGSSHGEKKCLFLIIIDQPCVLIVDCVHGGDCGGERVRHGCDLQDRWSYGTLGGCVPVDRRTGTLNKGKLPFTHTHTHTHTS